MIPERIKILIEGLSFDIAWHFFSEAEPKKAQAPMEEILKMMDAIPSLNVTQCMDAMKKRQLEVMTKPFRKKMDAIRKDLEMVAESYFEEGGKN